MGRGSSGAGGAGGSRGAQRNAQTSSTGKRDWWFYYRQTQKYVDQEKKANSKWVDSFDKYRNAQNVYANASIYTREKAGKKMDAARKKAEEASRELMRARRLLEAARRAERQNYGRGVRASQRADTADAIREGDRSAQAIRRVAGARAERRYLRKRARNARR